MPSPTHPAGPRPMRRLVGATLAVVALDQGAKAAAEHLSHPSALLLPMRNPALSLQMLDAGRWAETAAMTAGLVLAGLLLVPRVGRGALPVTWPALLLGGAAANLADRALLGAVRDFLPLGPVVLNPADLAVLAGLLGLLLTLTPLQHAAPRGPRMNPTSERR
jgi:lipoprotein signal peptidase